MTVLSPSGGDDAPQINAAITALPTRGGVVEFSPGDYLIDSTINLGDGTSSTRSTRSGIRLLGQGTPGWFPDFVNPEVPPVRLKWNGPAGGAIVKINGALHGWGLDNLVLDGNYGTAALGLRIEGGRDGDCSNLFIADCLNGLAMVNSGTANSMQNSFRNFGVWLHWLSTGGVAISLDGQRNPEGPNSCENLFTNLRVWLPGDRLCYGAYLKECDTNRFDHVIMFGGQTAGVGVALDYGTGNQQPGANSFNDIDMGGLHVQFQNIGTPGTLGTPNIVSLFQMGNGGVLPVLTNLVCADNDSFAGATLYSRGKTPTNGEAGLLLLVNKNGAPSLVQVKVGATNSGGSGKRALVIDN